MTPRQIAQLYLQGRKLRAEAAQLTNNMLASKFERRRVAITRIREGLPVSVPEDEQRLIRECIAEHDRLRAEASKITMAKLCRKYRMTHGKVERELILMGEMEVSA